MEDRIKVLAEYYGLNNLLNHNDISEEDVIRVLHREGLLNIDEYFAMDIPEWVTEEED